MRVRAFVGVSMLAVALAFSGCLTLVAAHVPNRLLEGAGGNGWERDDAHSQTEPTGGSFSLERTQTLRYQDAASGGAGYPGVLYVVTLRAVFTPSPSAVTAKLRDAVSEFASSNNIHLDDSGYSGARHVATGAASSFFVYNGSVSSSGSLFTTQNAKVKILGEVFPCEATRTSVVAVGLAQITDVRSIGGVPVGTNTDLTTWSEIAGDPDGSIENLRDVNGLVYNVVCQ
ncbi:MAG: hypothetical protein ACYDCK_10135 [Thermoplasmatota archaeon]